MSNFFDLEEFTEEDIKKVISEKFEESIILDFKRADSLQKNETKKKEIAKDVSAFANSSGGIIIYGMAEVDHVADSLDFIDGDEISKEWLEQIIDSRIQKKIEDLIIYPIRFKNDVKKTIYVVKIPESPRQPHMAGNKYYKRYNFQSVQMEEYEIREKYFRLQNTELTIFDVTFTQRGSSGGGTNHIYGYINFDIFFIIKNESNAIETNYNLECKIPKKIMYGNNQEIYEYLNRQDEDYLIYAIGNTDPLFQDEENCLCPVSIRLDKDKFNNPKNLILYLKLYYSNGFKEFEYDIRDILFINNKKIDASNFS